MNEVVRYYLPSAHKNREIGIKKPIMQKCMFSCQPSSVSSHCMSVGLEDADFVS